MSQPAADPVAPLRVRELIGRVPHAVAREPEADELGLLPTAEVSRLASLPTSVPAVPRHGGTPVTTLPRTGDMAGSTVMTNTPGTIPEWSVASSG